MEWERAELHQQSELANCGENVYVRTKYVHALKDMEEWTWVYKRKKCVYTFLAEGHRNMERREGHAQEHYEIHAFKNMGG